MKETMQRIFGGVKFPCVGQRTMKTVLVATLVSILYEMLGRNPCFACIGAVFGMGEFFHEGVKHGGNRFVGTLIGGVLVIPVYWLVHLSGLPIPKWVWIAAG